MSNRLRKDKTKYHVVFPDPEVVNFHFRKNYIRHHYDPKVLSSIWNKNRYNHIAKIPVVDIKSFSDIKFYNRMISILPLFNVLWFFINMMLFGTIYGISLIFQVDIPADIFTTLLSVSSGLMTVAFLIMNKYTMKKYFGTDDIFYTPPIEADYVMVLNEDRP